MRLSWYGDTGVAVFSIWQGGRCTGTFRLPVDELPRMMATLRGGPDGSDASHDVSGAHDVTRVRGFGGDGPARDFGPRELDPRDLGPREADPRDGAPRDAERTAAFPVPRASRHADPDLPPAGRGRASDPGYDIPSPARLPAEDDLSADPLGMGYRGAETASYRDGGPRESGRGSRGSYDDGRTDPGAGDPLSYRSGSESRGYGPSGGPDYPAADPLGDPLAYRPADQYRPADEPDYARREGRDYRGGGGRHYAAGEGPGYADEDRGYPAGGDRGYPPADRRGYTDEDVPAYRTAEGRHYPADDDAGYRAAGGRHYADEEAGPEGYHSWSEPEPGYAPAWAADYADSREFPAASGEDPYGHTPRAPRRDRRLAAGGHRPAGPQGTPHGTGTRRARLG